MRTTALVVLLALTLAAAPALAQDDDPVATGYATSYAAEARGDIPSALNAILEVLRKQPTDYVAMLRAGWLYYLKGQHGDAIVAYRKAVALAPRSLEAKVGLTLPLMAMARWAETEGLCREILATAPGNYLAMSRLAYAQFSRGDFAAAERSYRAVLVLYPSSVEMMLGLGWTLLKERRLADARALFDRVLQLNGDNLSARAGREACGQ